MLNLQNSSYRVNVIPIKNPAGLYIGMNMVCFFFFFHLFLLEANYFTILQWVLPYIDMNQPWIYMCSPSQSPLPPPSPPDPSGSFQCTSLEHLSHASNMVVLKFIWKGKGTRIANKVGGFTLCNLVLL